MFIYSQYEKTQLKDKKIKWEAAEECQKVLKWGYIVWFKNKFNTFIFPL